VLYPGALCALHYPSTMLITSVQGAEIFGLNVDKDNNVIYREWAPNATQAFLMGDFSMHNHPPCAVPSADELRR